jgi:hypothetical protein
MEIVGIFSAHLEYNMANLYILWSFANFEVIWYILPRFGILCEEKSGNPDEHTNRFHSLWLIC